MIAREAPAGAVINLLGLALPLALLQVYDRVIPYRAAETLVALALIVVAAGAIETVRRLARAVLAVPWARARARSRGRGLRHLARAGRLIGAHAFRQP